MPPPCCLPVIVKLFWPGQSRCLKFKSNIFINSAQLVTITKRRRGWAEISQSIVGAEYMVYQALANAFKNLCSTKENANKCSMDESYQKWQFIVFSSHIQKLTKDLGCISEPIRNVLKAMNILHKIAKSFKIYYKYSWEYIGIHFNIPF